MLQIASSNLSGTRGGISVQNKTDNTGGYFLGFYRSNNALIGNISQGSGSVAYNTTSDYRLKENVNYSFDATTRLKQLKPCIFNWIDDEDNTPDGVDPPKDVLNEEMKAGDTSEGEVDAEEFESLPAKPSSPRLSPEQVPPASVLADQTSAANKLRQANVRARVISFKKQAGAAQRVPGTEIDSTKTDEENKSVEEVFLIC